MMDYFLRGVPSAWYPSCWVCIHGLAVLHCLHTSITVYFASTNILFEMISTICTPTVTVKHFCVLICFALAVTLQISPGYSFELL